MGGGWEGDTWQIGKKLLTNDELASLISMLGAIDF